MELHCVTSFLLPLGSPGKNHRHCVRYYRGDMHRSPHPYHRQQLQSVLRLLQSSAVHAWSESRKEED